MKALRSLGYLLLLMLSSPFRSVSCAQEVLIKHLTVSDGLPDVTVYQALQDPQGFIWMCTRAGVSRFDGKKFTNYTLNDGLAENEILSLAMDSRQRIWFLGLSGTLSYFKDGKFFNAGNDPLLKKMTVANSFTFFYEDKLQRLWFSSLSNYVVIDRDSISSLNLEKRIPFSGGLIINNSGNAVYITNGGYSFDPDSKVLFKGKYTRKDRSGCAYLPDGSILFSANDGIVRQKDTAQELLFAFDESLKNVTVNTLLLSAGGKLWVSTAGKGLYCFDYNDRRVPPKHYLKDINAARLTEDGEGNIWVGTIDDGIYMLQPWYGIARNYNVTNDLESNNVFSVAKDSKGNIYAGMAKGRICVISSTGVSTILINNENLSYDRVLRIFAGANGIFFGSDCGIVRLNVRQNTKRYLGFKGLGGIISDHMPVKDICSYKNGLALCSTSSVYTDTALFNKDWHICPLEMTDGQNTRRYSVFADRNNVLWYSTSSGLYSFDGKRTISHSGINKFITERIISISQTADSTLILATGGQGVLFFKNDSVLAVFAEKDGLAHNICRRVFVHKDDVYISTLGGVTCFRYSKGRVASIRQFNTHNGLASNDINDICVDDSDICVATSGGLTIINAKAIDRASGALPVYITKVKSNDSVLAIGGTCMLSYRQNSLHFEYIGISYRSANDVHYRYRLHTGDTWMETKNTALDFPSLPSGDYNFQLEAGVLHGAWSDARSFAFTIRPPFWKTYWAFAFYVIMLILFFSATAQLFVRQALKKRNAQLKIEEQIINLEQQALQAMMNPHFVFNVMNSIQHYINNNDKLAANLYLSDFAKLIRMNLDISAKRYISIDDEVEYLSLYLSLERLRFGERLTYTVKIDPDIDTDETLIPVMMLQPFIENALWHGILPIKGNGHVQLEIQRQPGNMMKIAITDNGVGMPVKGRGDSSGIKSHTSKGMKMTLHRIDLLGKIFHRKLCLHICDAFPGQENRGTKVEITLPADIA